MNKVFVSVLTFGLLIASPAFAAGGMTSSRLQFANDWGRAIARFSIDNRPFLVQENPKTILEFKSKIYWLENQKNEDLKADLLKTF